MEPFERVKALLVEALELHASEYETFLDNLAPDDVKLRDDLARLLAAGDHLPDILSTDGAARMLRDHFEPAPGGLEPGQHLGRFEILAAVGSGGMGTVYSARDCRLERTVAIKVLSPLLTQNADYRRRFEREAKVISRLSHPNICTIFEVGNTDEFDYLVMEHLEGETLRQRIERGPLPIEDLLDIGIAIAGALEAAHRLLIIHRDLKPENILLTGPGVKLLDFGIAVLGNCPDQDEDDTSPVGRRGETPLMQAGFMGTMPYAAPERLRGGNVDHRCDLFSLGAVLHEMCCGRRPFAGKGTSLIAAIMSDEVRALSELTDGVPPSLESLVRSCLEKDPDDRIQTAHDAVLQLEWTRDQLKGSAKLAARSPLGTGSQRLTRVMTRYRWPALAALVLMLTTVGLTSVFEERGRVEATWRGPLMTRFEVGAPDGTMALDTPRLAPDGSTLAFLAVDSTGVSRIWLRPLRDPLSVPRHETEGARGLFWSPDSRSLGFFTHDMIKILDLGTGIVRPLCFLPPNANEPWASEAVWGRDGRIIFDISSTDSLLWIPESGGEASPLTRLDRDQGEIGHCRPSLLGNRLAYLVRRRLEYLALVVESSGKSRSELTHSNSRGLLSPGGYLLWVDENALNAQPFDAKRLALVGSPHRLAEGIVERGNCAREFSISDNGILAYRTRAAYGVELARLDRSGHRLESSIGEPHSDSRIPVTSWMGSGGDGVSPKGRWRAFAAEHAGRSEIYAQSLMDGAKRFQISRGGGSAPRWRDDGRELFYISPNRELMRVSVGGGEGAAFDQPERLFEIPFSIAAARQRFAVGPGGESFMFMLVAQEQATTPITVLLNWESSLP